MDNLQLWIIGGLLVIALGLLFSGKFKAIFTKGKLKLEASQREDKDQTSVKHIKNNSDVEIGSPKGRNISVEEVDNSKVKINR
jgi:CBS domain containing-hemolysin-like protein